MRYMERGGYVQTTAGDSKHLPEHRKDLLGHLISEAQGDKVE